MSHWATQISYQHFVKDNYSLAFKLVLQNHFRGLSSIIVRLLSGQCVYLNFDLWLTVSLRTFGLRQFTNDPPPKKKQKKHKKNNNKQTKN